MQRHFDVQGLAFPGLSQAVVAGPWVILSGQVALSDGRLVGPGDPAAQVEQCFLNIERVLAEAGCRLSDIVSLTCYLTDASVLAAYSEFKGRIFKERGPAATAVLVSGLLVPGAMIEIQATACQPPTISSTQK